MTVTNHPSMSGAGETAADVVRELRRLPVRKQGEAIGNLFGMCVDRITELESQLAEARATLTKADAAIKAAADDKLAASNNRKAKEWERQAAAHRYGGLLEARSILRALAHPNTESDR